MKKWKPLLKKAWKFIWEDDSVWSWIVNIVLAFVIIKFLIYPGLGLLFGTSFPIVAVVSDSMEHNGQNFETWWGENQDFYLKNGVIEQQFESFPFKNGFSRGDIMFLVGESSEDLRVGDILVFDSNKPYPIIHRLIDKRGDGDSGYYFLTKGDNNPVPIRHYRDPLTGDVEQFEVGAVPPNNYQVVLDEAFVSEDQVLGKAVLRVPFIGYLKIWFVDFLSFIGIL